jgi:hypothetical protein
MSDDLSGFADDAATISQVLCYSSDLAPRAIAFLPCTLALLPNNASLEVTTDGNEAPDLRTPFS